MRRLVWIALLILVPLGGARASSDEPWAMNTVESADGVKIAYYVAGELREGETPLIVISGGPGSDHRYMRVGGAFERLAKDRAVVMFDQRGTSRSGPASDAPQISDWAEDVEAIRRALGAPQADLLGHSFGGLVAMAYVEQFPDAVRSVVFMGSTAPALSQNKQLLADVFPDRIGEWTEVRQGLSPRFSATEISVFFSMEFVDPAVLPVYEEAVADYVYNIEVNNRLREELQAADYTNVLEAFEGPALVVHGRYDAVLAPSVAWALHELISGSEITFIERAGHLAFVEQPEAFASTVGGFLDRLDN